MFRFETKRLQMRPFKEDDKKRYIEICLDEEIQKYFSIGDDYFEIKNFFEETLMTFSKSDFVFAIIHQHNIIGFISYYEMTSNIIMIEYAIGYKYRRKGFALEALAGLLEYIKTYNSEINTATFCIQEGNNNSLKVIEKYNPIESKTFGTHSFNF
ncbi:MAG: GNAT family N-acetyltransferase [Clostridia bacterium]|nr:GNAT family N-acetyltransferase [Clostridia bacterium]